MATRDINDLIEPFRGSIQLLLQRAKLKNIPVLVTDVKRTLEEQKKLVKEGKSKTLQSKHLTGEAVDIAFEVNGKLSYQSELYEKLYTITHDIPYVVWPYRDYGWKWDKPHHQFDPKKKLLDNDLMYKENWEQEKRDHAESIKEKNENYRNWQHELDLRKEYQDKAHVNYEKWQTEIDKRKSLKKKIKLCEQNKFAGLTLLEKFMILFG